MSEFISKDMGARILSLRQAKKLTQKDFAKLAGIHVTFLSGVEKGQRNITVDTAQKIATALGVPIAELFVPQNLHTAVGRTATPVNFVKLGGTWDMQLTAEGLMGDGQLDDKQFIELEEYFGRNEEKLVLALHEIFEKTKPVDTTLGKHLPWVPELDSLAVGNFYPIFSGDSSHYRPAVMAPALAYLLQKATREPEKQVIAGMGTDTVDLLLPYLDAFLFNRHDIYPVLISGANRSFREDDSDAPQNFHNLAQATHVPLQPGAYYIFDRTIFKGGDITKVDPNESPTSLEGMVTFFAPQRTYARLGILETGSIRRENHVGVVGPIISHTALDYFNAMNHVLTVNLGDVPDTDRVIEEIADPRYKAVVIMSHALGNTSFPIRRAAITAAQAGKLVLNVSRAMMGNTSERYYVALGSANERELENGGALIIDGGRLSNRSAKALLVRALLEKLDQKSTKLLVDTYKTRTF